ncbi:unnamed protein product, partial [Gulo gulo]
GRRSHEEGGPAGRALCPPPSRAPRSCPATRLAPRRLSAFLGALEAIATGDALWAFGGRTDCAPTMVLAQPVFTDARNVLGGTRDTKTETDSDPACPHVARRLIELGSLHNTAE